MKQPLIKLIFVIFFFIFANDTAISFLSSPRVVLAFLTAFWIFFEWRSERMCAWIDGAMSVNNANRNVVKENFELSRTVMNLSEQHTLLCEIRNGVSRTLRFSKEVLVELKPPFAAA